MTSPPRALAAFSPLRIAKATSVVIRIRMIHVRLFVLLALLAHPAAAADVVYPTGSSIGLVPPPGLTMSHGFFGFEDRTRNVAIVIAALPAAAYGAVDKTLTAEILKKQGVMLETREDFPLSLGKAILAIGRQEVRNLHLHKWILAASTSKLTALVTVQIPDAARTAYPDAAVRASLATLAVRATVPFEEQLRLLPFRVHELAGFKVGGVLAGRAVLLTDGATDTPSKNTDTHIMVAVRRGGPMLASERGDFARDVFGTIPDLTQVRINTSEPLRIGGQFGHQIMAAGKDSESGADIKIVQWIRFGGGAYLHLVGVARSDQWLKAYARFRKVRDGIALH
jgi:hypothetical protein